MVKDSIGCKVRSIELSLTQRCASHMASLTDITESVEIGKGAVKSAIKGSTAVMITVDRADGDEYSVTVGAADIAGIANAIRTVPDDYINADGNGITDEGIAYLYPLIVGELPIEYENGLPKHFVI